LLSLLGLLVHPVQIIISVSRIEIFVFIMKLWCLKNITSFSADQNSK
jgi:hypothetical protein